ncbi:alpha/beta hydrolase [Streptomyces luteogriseus]|uniref:alpha/beta hydrolase n=1 Tax=Streptomyces luteogriseus TaxID=68233 RepID=UPI0037AC3DC9
MFAIRYRLNFEAAWPAQRDDVADAVAWIRSHAADFDVDPDRVLLLGSSAGGQLATDAAPHGAGALRLKGVVALSPVASPYRAWKRSMVSENWVDPADAPMYLVHSEDDFVPPAHSTDLEATAEAKGVPSGRIQTQVVAGAAHGGSLLSAPGVYDRIVAWLKSKA